MRGESAIRTPASVEEDSGSQRNCPAGAIPTRSSAQSATLRAIGPATSRLGASGTTPASDTSPRVGLIVEVPLSAEGIRSDPAVSVPVAAGTMCAARAAPDPPLEPPAERARSHGFPT